jgi:hypothetical protein
VQRWTSAKDCGNSSAKGMGNSRCRNDRK